MSDLTVKEDDRGVELLEKGIKTNDGEVIEAEVTKRKTSENDKDNVYVDLNVNIHNEKLDFKNSKSSLFDVHRYGTDFENGRMSVASQTVDGNVIAAGVQILKTLDANRYATKKTIAQGMLDIALLTANASQLKYILQVGHKHEFYTLMLSLIIVSIILQVSAAILSVVVTALRQYEGETLNQISWILNHVSIAFVTGALFCDVVKMSFGLDPAVAVNSTQNY